MGTIEDLINKGKIKKVRFSEEMYKKELRVGERDLESAKESFENENYKWATIQAYYAIFHAVRSLAYKEGYREESHTALKNLFKELYIKTNKLPLNIYNSLENGMNLREMAEYKETYSRSGAENIIISVSKSIEDIKRII